MAMTMPVITSYSGKLPLRMAFVLPTDAAASVVAGAWGDSSAPGGVPGGTAADLRAAAAPVPSSPRVCVSAKPASRVAVREFGGFATAGEVARQLFELKARVYKAGLAPQETEVDCYQVYQYNSPATLPFLRRNEIAIRLRTSADKEEEEMDLAAPANAAESEAAWANLSAEENGMPSD